MDQTVKASPLKIGRQIQITVSDETIALFDSAATAHLGRTRSERMRRVLEEAELSIRSAASPVANPLTRSVATAPASAPKSNGNGAGISDRDQKVLSLASQGKSHREIGAALGIAPSTVGEIKKRHGKG